MKCNGSLIPEPSPWADLTTPNLNEAAGRFLRGGTPDLILTFQEDAFQVTNLETNQAKQTLVHSEQRNPIFFCIVTVSKYFQISETLESYKL